jgi:hypothetical protein
MPRRIAYKLVPRQGLYVPFSRQGLYTTYLPTSDQKASLKTTYQEGGIGGTNGQERSNRGSRVGRKEQGKSLG